MCIPGRVHPAPYMLFSSPESTHIPERPHPDERFTVYITPLDKSPKPAVIGFVTVVSHHEIRILRYHYGIVVIPLIDKVVTRRYDGRVFVMLGSPPLLQYSIDVHLFPYDLHYITGNPDTPLHVEFGLRIN